MNYSDKFKKDKKDQARPLAETNFMDLSFMESLIITASLDGLLDLGSGVGYPVKQKTIHKLK